MYKAIYLILCIIAFASANHKLINAYPYHDDSCSLGWYDSVTFNNGIILYLSGWGIWHGGCITLEILNDSYASLGYKDTSNADIVWASSDFMPTELIPLDTVVKNDSAVFRMIRIGEQTSYAVPEGGCPFYMGFGCNRIFYAKAKDNSNMKFQINHTNITRSTDSHCWYENAAIFNSITIIFATDSSGNGRFTNGSTKLRMNNINTAHKINTSPIYVDLRGKLRKKDMLNKFRCIIKKEHLILR